MNLIDEKKYEKILIIAELIKLSLEDEPSESSEEIFSDIAKTFKKKLNISLDSILNKRKNAFDKNISIFVNSFADKLCIIYFVYLKIAKEYNSSSNNSLTFKNKMNTIDNLLEKEILKIKSPIFALSISKNKQFLKDLKPLSINDLHSATFQKKLYGFHEDKVKLMIPNLKKDDSLFKVSISKAVEQITEKHLVILANELGLDIGSATSRRNPRLNILKKAEICISDSDLDKFVSQLKNIDNYNLRNSIFRSFNSKD